MLLYLTSSYSVRYYLYSNINLFNKELLMLVENGMIKNVYVSKEKYVDLKKKKKNNKVIQFLANTLLVLLLLFIFVNI